MVGGSSQAERPRLHLGVSLPHKMYSLNDNAICIKDWSKVIRCELMGIDGCARAKTPSGLGTIVASKVKSLARLIGAKSVVVFARNKGRYRGIDLTQCRRLSPFPLRTLDHHLSIQAALCCMPFARWSSLASCLADPRAESGYLSIHRSRHCIRGR